MSTDPTAGTTGQAAFVVSRDECQAGITGVCPGCGGEVTPIETVDNANRPTFWSGCEHCSVFTEGYEPEIHRLARTLVEEGTLVPYPGRRRDDPGWLESNTRRAAQILHRIDRLRADTTGQAAPDLMGALADSLKRARAEREARELAEIGATLARFDFGGSYAFQVQQLAEERDRVLAENARLRQERNTIAELADTQLEGWRKTRAERNEAREGWATLAGIAEEVAQQLEAKDSRVRRSWAAKELREAVETFGPKAAPSATETAPQTVPGVTGHTEPRPWRVLDDKGREILRITAPRPGAWRSPNMVAEITATSYPDGGCTHMTAVDADDAHGLAATLLRLAGHTEAPTEPCRAYWALHRLVELHDGPRDAAYRAAKGHAWDAAREALAEREAHNPPASGEGAALIAATEQEIRDMGGDDPAGVEQLIGQRDVWRETAQTLARKVDERHRERNARTAAEEKARDLEQQLAEVRADLSATYKLGNESIREHTALILGVQAIAERIEQYADANDPGVIVYARDLRALTQPTTQPAASDAHIGSNAAGGHDA